VRTRLLRILLLYAIGSPLFSQTLTLVQSGFAGDASGCNSSLSCTVSTTVGVTKLSQAFGANHVVTLVINGEGTNNFPVPGTPSCNGSGCGTWTHVSGGNVVSASGSSTTSGNYCAVQDLNSTGHHFFSDCWVVLVSSGGATGITVPFTDAGGASDITNMDLFVAEYSCSQACSPAVDTQAALVYPGNGVSAGCTSCAGPSMTPAGTNDLVVQNAVFEENCNSGCAVPKYSLVSFDTNAQNATADSLDVSSAPQAVWSQNPKGGGIFVAFAINLNFGSSVCNISPTSLPPYTAGEPVSQQFTASNCGSSSFIISSGSLSGSGLSLSSSGMLSGTAEAGTFNFTVAAGTAANSISLTVNASTVSILHTTFCGPGSSWPGTCPLSAPTSAGSRLVVVYSSYNSAGSTPVMNSITDSAGDTFSQLANARSTNTNSASSWNDMWTAGGVAAGQTALTITPSTTEIGDVYVWEVQYANSVVGCASLSSQPAANPAIGAAMTTGANVLLLSHLHPGLGGNPIGVSSPFTSDTISDEMAYAHDMTSSAGTNGPQWTQTAVTYAAATCAFSAALVAPPTSLTTTVH
jgi:hypothetical protein